MKTKNKLIITAMAIVAITTMSLAVIGCEEDEEPQEHENTITAFGRDITIKGDASISENDFNTAKDQLQKAMKVLSDGIPDGESRERFNNMLDRPGFVIMIKTGNAGPDASGDKKTMLIGVRYLIDNDVEPTIAGDIATKVVANNAFKD
jgi:uncharacterized lipoprotein NlpE involved in copper resistance